MATNEKHVSKSHVISSKGQIVMICSIIVGVLICAILFSVLGTNMRTNSNKAIDEVGTDYMRNTGYQIVQRFESVMEQRVKMLEGLVLGYNPDDPKYIDNPDNLRADLAKNAEGLDFKFLAFYRVTDAEDDENGGEVDPLLGTNLSVADKKPFRESVIESQPKIAVGKGTDLYGDVHDNIVIISVPATSYTLKNSGEKSQALLAGITNTLLVDMLNINPDDSDNASAYIVRKNAFDGKTNSFILKPENKAKEFDYLSDLLEDRLKNSDIDVANIILEINAKMQMGQEYSSIVHVNGHHVHLYGHNLNNSEWYLVTLMSSDDINGVIQKLGNQWVTLIVVAIATIIVLLIVIFVVYSYFNKQNITQLEIAREQAIDASKAKGEFLSNMSHDIRTPMNAIVGMTAIARTNIDNKQQVQDCLKKIAISSKHLLGLINDVLDMSKIESGKMTLNMEQVSLPEVLEGITTIVQPQIKTKNQKFNVVVHNIEQENVYCDSVRLNQMMLNLLSNAIKFTAEDGTIEMFLDQEQSPLGDKYVRTHIRVHDNGIGMTDDFQRKIFESFAREDNLRVHRTEGTGLGMTITKYIVDAMNGSIELNSELGEGTKFHITLDLERALVTEEKMTLPSWRMLIVDDDEQLCETTKITLGEIGIDAEWTLDGDDAIKKIDEARKNGKGFDIVLLDWRLSNLDGIELAKQIRQKVGQDNLSILLMSAYDWSEIEVGARKAGINGFISKPLFKSTLFYGLKSFVGSDEVHDKVKKSSRRKANLSGVHVLLAEDNELNWEIAESLLGSIGITCDHAENGQVCLDMLKNSNAGTYKAILMDIRMPVMNGYEATMEIRKLNHPDKGLPIVAMTADAFSDDIKHCLDCGMNAHIAKPIDIEIVRNTLAKFIKKK